MRYRATNLGVLWTIVSPLITVLMFSFVFGAIFQSRWNGASPSTPDFVIIVLIGMTLHGILAESLGRAPTIIVAQPAYVKKVVFPLEVLPLVTTIGALLNAAIMLAIVLGAAFVISGGFSFTALWLPVVVLPYVVLVAGITLFVSAIGVYIRDMSQITGLVSTATLFLSPVFYPISAVPSKYQFLLYLNPLTFIVEEARNVTLFGREPDWIGTAWYFALASIFTWLGYCWFQKTRNGFADVI